MDIPFCLDIQIASEFCWIFSRVLDVGLERKTARGFCCLDGDTDSMAYGLFIVSHYLLFTVNISTIK